MVRAHAALRTRLSIQIALFRALGSAANGVFTRVIIVTTVKADITIKDRVVSVERLVGYGGSSGFVRVGIAQWIPPTAWVGEVDGGRFTVNAKHFILVCS